MEAKTLHSDRVPQAKTGTSPATSRPATRRKIPTDSPCRALLMASDNVHTRLVGMVLTENDIVVQTAANAAEVSEAISAQIPNVILLDWDVDGLDGRSILRIIKKNPKSRHIPVLVMTNRAVTETMKREMMMYGVQWILEKPIVALSLPKLIIRTAEEGTSMEQTNGFFQRKALLVDFGQTASGAMWKSVW